MIKKFFVDLFVGLKSFSFVEEWDNLVSNLFFKDKTSDLNIKEYRILTETNSKYYIYTSNQTFIRINNDQQLGRIEKYYDFNLPTKNCDRLVIFPLGSDGAIVTSKVIEIKKIK